MRKISIAIFIIISTLCSCSNNDVNSNDWRYKRLAQTKEEYLKEKAKYEELMKQYPEAKGDDLNEFLKPKYPRYIYPKTDSGILKAGFRVVVWYTPWVDLSGSQDVEFIAEIINKDDIILDKKRITSHGWVILLDYKTEERRCIDGYEDGLAQGGLHIYRITKDGKFKEKALHVAFYIN